MILGELGSSTNWAIQLECPNAIIPSHKEAVGVCWRNYSISSVWWLKFRQPSKCVVPYVNALCNIGGSLSVIIVISLRDQCHPILTTSNWVWILQKCLLLWGVHGKVSRIKHFLPPRNRFLWWQAGSIEIIFRQFKKPWNVMTHCPVSTFLTLRVIITAVRAAKMD